GSCTDRGEGSSRSSRYSRGIAASPAKTSARASSPHPHRQAKFSLDDPLQPYYQPCARNMGSKKGRRPRTFTATAVAVASLLLFAANSNAVTRSVTISVSSGNTIPAPGATTNVTLGITGTASVPSPGIVAFDLVLGYDSAVVTATGAALPG